MDVFKQYYDTMDFKYGVSKSRRKKILSLLGDPSNKKVLDVGCAGGYLGEEIKKMGAKEVVGIDLSERAIAEAKKRIDGAFAIDIQNTAVPFEDGHFDVIIFSEVIEHLIFPEKALQELKRVLRADGAIIITTPNLLVFSNRMRMLFGVFEYKDFTFFERGHIHFFTVDSLKKAIAQEGFRLDKMDNLIHPKIPVWLGKIFPNLFVYQAIFKIKKNEK